MPLRDLIDELHDRVFEYGDFRGIESSGAVGSDFPLGTPVADPKGDDEPTIQAKQKDTIRKLTKSDTEVSEGRTQSFSKSRKICPPGFRKHKSHGRCVPQNIERWSVDNGRGTVGWVGEKSGEPVVHTGSMVCFYPSADVVQQLSKFSTEDQEIHLTFIYLGKDLTDDQKTLCKRTLEGFARWCPPQITGTIGGVGRFNASETSDGKSVVYASVDIPSLDERRAELIKRLKAEAGIDPERTHGYSPHITLRYTDAPGMPKLPTIPLSFDSITLKCGEDRYDYALGSSTEAKSNPFDALAAKIKRIRVKNAMLRPSDITRAPDTSDGTNDQKL